MKSISIPGSMSIKALEFKGVGSKDKPSFDPPLVHVFELLRFTECNITWQHDTKEGEFNYPSEEWLAEKLQEVLNERA